MSGQADRFSVIIPVYRNEANLPRLLAELEKLSGRMPGGIEAVLVVDGSPDRCHEILSEKLPSLPFKSQLLQLSRNFGSFSAIMAGMSAASGEYCGVMVADLQEPPELMLEFQRMLSSGAADVCFGVRTGRSDGWLTELTSNLFWWVFRKFVVKEMPPGGVDVFGCNRAVRDHVARFSELHSNLIGLLFWIGFRRKFVPYVRQPRLEGVSAWTTRKKVQYCLDSLFTFTDLPLRALSFAGILGMTVAVLLAVIVLIAKLTGRVPVQGYVPVMLTIMFFGGLTSAGLGIVGRYLWMVAENVRGRPVYIVQSSVSFAGWRGPSGLP